MRISDWSSDVCSSDLQAPPAVGIRQTRGWYAAKCREINEGLQGSQACGPQPRVDQRRGQEVHGLKDTGAGDDQLQAAGLLAEQQVLLSAGGDQQARVALQLREEERTRGPEIGKGSGRGRVWQYR